MKEKIPIYLKEILKKYPQIKSGRKNYLAHYLRLIKKIKIIDDFKKTIKK